MVGLNEDRNTVLLYNKHPHSSHAVPETELNPIHLALHPSRVTMPENMKPMKISRYIDTHTASNRTLIFAMPPSTIPIAYFPRRPPPFPRVSQSVVPLYGLMYITKQQPLIPLQQRIQPLFQRLRLLPFHTQCMFRFLYAQRECCVSQAVIYIHVS